MTGAYELVLAKEDFKFSVAHFTIFAARRAERLHGHNYSVVVRVSGHETDEQGLLVDVGSVKKRIRGICAELDESTLVPSRSPLVELEEGSGTVVLRFAERVYELPVADVSVLDLRNITIEELARFFWGRLAEDLQSTRATELSVEVAETPGQSCVYRSALG